MVFYVRMGPNSASVRVPVVVGIHLTDLHASLDGVHGIEPPVGFPMLSRRMTRDGFGADRKNPIHRIAGFEENFVWSDFKVLVEQGESKTMQFAVLGENLADFRKASFVVKSEWWAVVNIGEGIRDELVRNNYKDTKTAGLCQACGSVPAVS